MAYRDFQHFLEVLEAKGELKRIDHPVSPHLEITEIADRVMKAGGPALLFTNPSGTPQRRGTPDASSAVMGRPSIDPHVRPLDEVTYPYPVAINTMGSRRRMSLALGVEDFEEHAARLGALIPPPIPQSKMEGVKLALDVFKDLKGALPKTVKSGICQEVVQMGDEVDLTKIPVLNCWPEDGGPYITLPLVFTNDPNTGKRNVGMYRVQVYDKNTCGMHWQMHKTGMRHMEEAGAKGQRIQVAVVLGGDPAYTFSAISPLPPGLDEMAFAGFLRKESAELVTACRP